MDILNHQTAVGFTLLLVLSILATYAISFTVTIMDGPFDVLKTLKIRIGAFRRDHNNQPTPTVLGKLLSCPFCLGVWVAAVITWAIFPHEPTAVLVWLAIVGGQIFLQAKSGE